MKPWLYRGGINTLPTCPDAGYSAPCLYLLQFHDRCKVGISVKPPIRLKTLHTNHLKACSAGVLQVAISEPTKHAFRVEQDLLGQFGVLRLVGEYLAIDFDTLSVAATDALNHAGTSAVPRLAQVSPVLNVKLCTSVPVRKLAPKILPLGSERDRYAVEWHLHESALWVSEWQTLQKTFETHYEASRFCVRMWQIWLATFSATGIHTDRVLGLDNSLRRAHVSPRTVT